MIAHRLATIQNATRIIVLDHGEIKEEGTHQDLIRKGAWYFQLYKIQFKEKADVLDVVVARMFLPQLVEIVADLVQQRGEADGFLLVVHDEQRERNRGALRRTK